MNDFDVFLVTSGCRPVLPLREIRQIVQEIASTNPGGVASCRRLPSIAQVATHGELRRTHPARIRLRPHLEGAVECREGSESGEQVEP